jgi:hypothetical protein
VDHLFLLPHHTFSHTAQHIIMSPTLDLDAILQFATQLALDVSDAKRFSETASGRREHELAAFAQGL